MCILYINHLWTFTTIFIHLFDIISGDNIIMLGTFYSWNIQKWSLPYLNQEKTRVYVNVSC